MDFSWRREGDSNPRRLSPYQFSRLAHSTTLTSLHINIVFSLVRHINSIKLLVECAMRGPRNYWLVEGERKSLAKMINLRLANYPKRQL